MEEKKYYCVKLNGYNNKNSYYGLTKKNTLLDGVLKKEYSKLDKDNLDYDFLSLDSKVTSFKNSFLVEGFFPVIAEEVDGKLTIISGKIASGTSTLITQINIIHL